MTNVYLLKISPLSSRIWCDLYGGVCSNCPMTTNLFRLPDGYYTDKDITCYMEITLHYRKEDMKNG